MEPKDARVQELQEALSAINLQPSSDSNGFEGDRLLLGTILTTRVYRRFTLSEIITKAWGPRIKIENLGQNFFKFVFSAKAERDRVFRGRPWNINGAHLILKEWPETMAINKVPFDTTTFTIQIHGLPPMFLHAGSAKLIGNRVGKVYEDSINRKAVVGHRFLRFKLDIEVRKPIPAGYFLSSHSDNENWIQFKYERLGDFCYKCGFLDHVTGRCDFEKPAFITSADGASARLYGPWLRAEHKGDLLFVNTPAEQEVAPVIGTGPKEGSFPSSESLIHKLEFALGCTDKTGEDDLQNAVETSQEFGALKLTLERKSSGDWPDIRAELINQVRISNNDP